MITQVIHSHVSTRSWRTEAYVFGIKATTPAISRWTTCGACCRYFMCLFLVAIAWGWDNERCKIQQQLTVTNNNQQHRQQQQQQLQLDNNLTTPLQYYLSTIVFRYIKKKHVKKQHIWNIDPLIIEYAGRVRLLVLTQLTIQFGSSLVWV